MKVAIHFLLTAKGAEFQAKIAEDSLTTHYHTCSELCALIQEL